MLLALFPFRGDLKKAPDKPVHRSLSRPLRFSRLARPHQVSNDTGSGVHIGTDYLEADGLEDSRRRFMTQPVAMVDFRDRFGSALEPAGLDKINDVAIKQAVRLQEFTNVQQTRTQVKKVLDRSTE